MEITLTQKQNVSVIALKGRLDVITSNDLNAVLMGEIERGARMMVVDFQEVDYVSSSGLRVLLQARKRLKGLGGTLILSGIKDFVRDVLTAVGFDTIFPITGTTEDGVASLRDSQ